MEVRVLKEENKDKYISSMQEAFQYGFESNGSVLSKEDIEADLGEENTYAYEMVNDNDEIIGGVVVTINKVNDCNHLDFIFIKPEEQGKGYGDLLWRSIEKLYPETIFWEGVTPYFDKRNIHFYVNKLGFHIVEYFNSLHFNVDNTSLEGMFRVKKDMRKF